MDLDRYLNSVTLNKIIEGYAENAKLETFNKTVANFKALAGDAFNEGIISILARKNQPKKGSLEKSKEITDLLPDRFCKGEMGKTAINNIIEAIKSAQTEGILNIGYEELIRREVENMVRIIYAIGITSGFQIAEDPDYKALYSVNQDRFLMHGSIAKEEPEKTSKKKSTKE
jgi:hypothetical protein